ncbi:MAG: EAL domain-containing protein [Acidimicrobiia bacterium]|nr:EAL domain-containing protein [Acidimicrobiia bacterium]
MEDEGRIETWDWADFATGLAYHYQPVVAWPHRHVIGHEVLLRTVGPFTGPFELFQAAMSDGVQSQLDRTCLESAIRTTPLRRSGTLFVNCLPSTLISRHVRPAELIGWLVAQGAEPGRVVLEVTEYEYVEDVDALARAIAELKAAGIAVALDDCGEGHGTFTLAGTVKPTYVKVDRRVIQTECEEPSGLLDEITTFCASIGAVPIAEGVETAGQGEALGRAGFILMQGHFLGRPKPALAPVLLQERVTAEVCAAIDESLGRRRARVPASAAWLDVVCRDPEAVTAG